MESKSLEIKVALQVMKPVNTVFEAIIDPEHMTNYFISESSGKMVDGETLTWKFSEFPIEFPIHVEKIEQDRYISYRWEHDGEMLLVEMTLEPVDGGTVVTITEKSRANDEKGLAWLGGNSAGWANFLACLKAYLEYGINLRKGAFDFMAQ
jgi:uncharacterized protein YndB with AHSA1/START domain